MNRLIFALFCLQMHKYNRLDFEETNLKPSLLESSAHLLEALADQQETFEKHRKRLVVVRQEKREREKQLFGNF